MENSSPVKRRTGRPPTNLQLVKVPPFYLTAEQLQQLDDYKTRTHIFSRSAVIRMALDLLFTSSGQ